MTTVGNIDDTLTEIIKLKNVKIALVEWLPFDRNQLSALNIKLDSLHRKRGHIVTARKDNSPSEIIFKDDGISCKVIVEEFEPSEYVSFHAFLNFPEEDGINQTEEISGNINSWGRVIYGADLIEAEGSIDGWISLDILTRIIVDLTMDTSQMIDSLLTEYQRNLLDLVFMKESAKRTKVLLLLADEISVHPESPQEFFDGEELQNELEQVIGVLQKVESLSEGFLFKGSSGMIAASKNIKNYEQSLLERSFSNAIRLFLDDYSSIIWHLWDESRFIEKDIDKAMLGDITSLTRAQNWITRASSDAIMLSDILSYLRDSITEFVSELAESDPKRLHYDPLIQELKLILDDSHITTKRVNDTQKVIHGLESKMVALRDFSNALAEKHMRRISDSMAQNTKSMTQMTESNNRASDALSIIELILAGSVIIDVVLVLVGEYAYPEWLGNLFNSGFGSIIVLGVTAVLWISMFIFLRLSKRRLESSAIRRQRGAYVIGRKCNVENLENYLTTKNILLRNTECEGESELISVTWEPHNNKGKPEISSVILYFDAKEKFIIQIDFESSDMTINLKRCYDYLIAEMEESGIFNLHEYGNACY
ncbi:MAG TPA: hypothetical protein VMX55_00725 [candidate division Zixibacteria bacterium]|nr:hypothetical protein [candidate division Zixibacteria bacterium]